MRLKSKGENEKFYNSSKFNALWEDKSTRIFPRIFHNSLEISFSGGLASDVTMPSYE